MFPNFGEKGDESTLGCGLDGQTQIGVDGAQLALGLLSVSWDTGDHGTGQVDNAPLNQVEDGADGDAEEGVGSNAAGAEKSLDELVVGFGELYMTVS